ncbi:hypothetical protein EON63_05830 [archaeon]|nr:MAG: hypothetical protein EON63_05830 [archaeon]
MHIHVHIHIHLHITGNRVVTGSVDYHIRLYDFGGMDNRHMSFKSLEVQEAHPIIGMCVVWCMGMVYIYIYIRCGVEGSFHYGYLYVCVYGA